MICKVERFSCVLYWVFWKLLGYQSDIRLVVDWVTCWGVLFWWSILCCGSLSGLVWSVGCGSVTCGQFFCKRWGGGLSMFFWLCGWLFVNLGDDLVLWWLGFVFVEFVVCFDNWDCWSCIFWCAYYREFEGRWCWSRCCCQVKVLMFWFVRSRF